MHFKDSILSPSADGKKTIKNKGEHNNAISSLLFKYLESYHIHTHFIESLKGSEMVVKRLEMISIEAIIWNFTVGSLSKRFGIEKGMLLANPILEYYLKDSKRHNPMINPDHASAFGYATPEEMKRIDSMARKINAVLKSFFERRKLNLVNIKMEFGRVEDQILLGDEISPDTCLFLDFSDEERPTRQFVFDDANNMDKVYAALRDRILSR